MLNIVKVRKKLSSKMLPRSQFLFFSMSEFDKEQENTSLITKSGILINEINLKFYLLE